MSHFATSDIITIYVGPERRVYTAHKDLLIARSPFFEKCLQSGFKEGKQNEVCAEEDVPEAFDLLVIWIYTETVTPLSDLARTKAALHAYMLADKYCMITFQNAIVDAMRERFAHCYVEIRLLALLQEYNGLCGKLKNLLLDQIGFDIKVEAKYKPGGVQRQRLDEFLSGSVPIAAEVLWAYYRCVKENYKNPAELQGCHYHEHPDGSSACSKAADEKSTTATRDGKG